MKLLGFAGLLLAINTAASAQTPKPPVIQAEALLSAPLRQQEAVQLTAYSALARREGSTLILSYYGETRHQREVARLTDGEGGCARYVFTGVKRLFSGYLHVVTDMAEVNCDNGEIAARFIQNDRLRLWSYTTSTATPDGRYLLAGGNSIYPDVSGATVFSVAQNMASGGFAVACPDIAPLSDTRFKVDCGAFSGEIFRERGWQMVRKRFRGDSRDGAPEIIPSIWVSITNGGDPFESTQEEAEALALFPGLARRDGPDLVILDNGLEVRRITDRTSGCPERPFRGGPNRFWFQGALNLYDAQTKAVKPVALVRCQAGEFAGFMLVPSQGDALYVPGAVSASPDGRHIAHLTNLTWVIDWTGRKDVLRYEKRCRDVVWSGPARFEALCDGDKKTTFQRKGDMWQVEIPD